MIRFWTAAQIFLFLLASPAVLGITPIEQRVLNDLIGNITGLSSLTKPWVRDVDPCTTGTATSLFTGLDCRQTTIARIILPLSGLSGQIPDSIGLLVGLESISFGGNNLNGTVPSSISNMQNLTVFNVGSNQLTGTFPDGITTLPKLTIINFSANKFFGPIPSNWSAALTYISIGGNNWSTGLFSSSLLQLPQLLQLNLDYPRLGPVNFTAFIESVNLPNLTSLSMVGGNLTGTIPSFCGRMDKVKALTLDGNPGITGVVGPGLECLTQLQALSLENSMINTVGPEISALTSLTFLSLSGSNFTNSTIPDVLATIPRLATLRFLKAGLVGPIPASLFSSPSLTTILLGQNSLSGELPPINMPTLVELGLDSNANISGTIPLGLMATKLKGLNLSGTNISGTIPSEISNLTSTLVRFNVGRTRLSGPIPDSF
eukprot:TRINITY_DN13721_c0_g1_i1.p1 TRINITY_DN13721_c0_g1~~TRINITY_DN13721_c0_g1_i1.p1  ORF type:complete len:431 (+),score=36.36 TRINITY_DN13721_c0_g1_i1:65-1357(+)